MTSLRPWLSAVLGLALLAQGFVVAASQLPAAKAGTTSQQSVQSEMPCHGSAPAAAKVPCACCDGDCSNMSGCPFGGTAAVLPAPGLPWPPAPQAAIATPDRLAESVSLPLPLRPPISIRA